MKKIIVVLGALPLEKDAYSKLIAESLNYKLFSADEVINEEITNKTKVGLIMEKYSQSEAQVPDEYLIMLMKERIINFQEDGIVFHNFPKTINQAKALDSFLFAKKINRPIPVLIDTEVELTISNSRGDLESSKTISDLVERKIKSVILYYSPFGLKFDTTTKTTEVINEEILTAVKAKCSLI